MMMPLHCTIRLPHQYYVIYFHFIANPLHPFWYYFHNNPLSRSRMLHNVIKNILTYKIKINIVPHHKTLEL